MTLCHHSFPLLGHGATAGPLPDHSAICAGSSIHGAPCLRLLSPLGLGSTLDCASIHWAQSERRGAVCNSCSAEPQHPTSRCQRGTAQCGTCPWCKPAPNWASKGKKGKRSEPDPAPAASCKCASPLTRRVNGRKRGRVFTHLHLKFWAPNPTHGGSIQIPSQFR